MSVPFEFLIGQEWHLYELRPRRDRRGFDLLSEALAFGRLCYQQADRRHRIREILQPVATGEVRVFDGAVAMISVENWPGQLSRTVIFIP